MKVALLGLPQAGKKTFFALLTNRSGGAPPTLPEAASLEGVAPIRDPRVAALADLFRPERVKLAENIIVLCPDVTAGSGRRAWVEAARQCDLLCLVVRAFAAPEVYHPSGAVDAARDRAFLEAECLLADLELVEIRLERLGREKRGGQGAQQAREEQALSRIKGLLEQAAPRAPLELSPVELEAVRSLNLLALKPWLWALNVDEEALRAPSPADEFRVSCRIEREIMELDNPADRQDYLADLGLAGSGLDRLNQAAYEHLGLLSFYTVGPDEVRAWTIRRGTAAPAAAGKVHSDIERGFIRVEVTRFDDLLAAGGEAAAKARGLVQVRGRDYIIADGDVCHFRFNV